MEPKTLEMFAIHAPVLELALRGAVIYLLLFALFRFFLRHQAVSFGIVEVVALVLIADASQNAMAGETTYLAESAILALSMIASHTAVRFAYLLRHRLLRHRRARRARSHEPHGTTLAGPGQ